MRGFTLIEMMMSLLVLTSGLLAVGQMLYVAASSASLSRSKGSAAVAAQDRLESLASLYRRNPSSADLALGAHGPQQVEVLNPSEGNALNRFNVLWDVQPVEDPRPGKVIDARRINVTIEPAFEDGTRHNQPGWNKTVCVSTILSPRMR